MSTEREKRDARRQLLCIFVAMIGIFGLLGWRNEVLADRQDAQQHHADVTNYNRCERSRDIDRKLNATFAATVALLDGFRPDNRISHIQDVFRNATITLPDCGSKP